MFRFSCKLGDYMRDMLKCKGFRWSSKRGVWSRQWTNNGIIAAKQIRAFMAVTD